MRPWTEEKEDEVIYNVYLKKTDQLNSLQTPEKNWLAVKWRTVKSRTIKAATVEKLVEHLPTVIEEMDSLYLHTFFNTYLTFTNLQYVLKLLMHRYYEACHIPGSQRENLKRSKVVCFDKLLFQRQSKRRILKLTGKSLLRRVLTFFVHS
ncbi:putative ral guanine nucleotide dissociation stimulator isoform X4 [Apostichopus japonicus]|uniref:Putative ral guanine nucleotide dissociation stimulator isoform X4 n=1 Tax=Stichopus japonicus TaxID=307972 RepID=A0A2G8KM18_STIJA|nr:putative ral guanine nucleotide dissociation stimulator isoform X4 [Apostichopus japonicus]